jgi:hypothetical protein
LVYVSECAQGAVQENSPIDPFGGAKGFDFYAGDTKKERIEVSGEISEKAQKSLITRYETITPIRNALKIKNNLCNHFLESG